MGIEVTVEHMDKEMQKLINNMVVKAVHLKKYDRWVHDDMVERDIFNHVDRYSGLMPEKLDVQATAQAYTQTFYTRVEELQKGGPDSAA